MRQASKSMEGPSGHTGLTGTTTTTTAATATTAVAATAAAAAGGGGSNGGVGTAALQAATSSRQACYFADATQQVGSLMYMAPELFSSHQYNEKVVRRGGRGGQEERQRRGEAEGRRRA